MWYAIRISRKTRCTIWKLRGSISRYGCEEIIAGNPVFSKIDEALFIAGKSNLYLSEGKGKQKPSLYVRHEGGKTVQLTSEEFRDEARSYFSQLADSYPNSKFRAEALEDLRALGGPKAKQ